MVDATTDGDDTQKNTWSNCGTNHIPRTFDFFTIFDIFFSRDFEDQCVDKFLIQFFISPQPFYPISIGSSFFQYL